MKKWGVIWLIIVGMSLGVGRVRAVACYGWLTCERFDTNLGVCTTVGQTTYECVQSGNSCAWQQDCDKCVAHGDDCPPSVPLPSGATPTPTPPPTGPTCAASGYPSCNGYCTGGEVCKAIAATESCNCGTATSCSNYM